MRWQADPLFVAWLDLMGYTVDGEPVVSDGVLLYMWEAWRAAQGVRTWPA